jgi:hypothetical protein
LTDYWQKTVEKWRFAEVDISGAHNNFGGYYNAPNHPSHQYQQNELSPLILTEFTENKRCWESKVLANSLLLTGSIVLSNSYIIFLLSIKIVCICNDRNIVIKIRH